MEGVKGTTEIAGGVTIDTVPLSKKVGKGALWVTVTTICARAISLLSNILLARLMVPIDFGLFALATTIIVFSQGTTQTGFESALIQKQDRPELFLNTAWTFELIRYFILFLIIFFGAPALAIFFNEPRAVSILRVISLTLIFQGLRNIGVVFFRKNFDFYKQFILEIVPLVVYLSVVIPLAFQLRNVWAMVIGTFAASLTTCLVSYLLHPYRPRLDLNLERAKSLFSFGKWILGTSILAMARDQGTNMFLGRFLGVSALGLFNRADGFSTAIFQQITDVVWKIGYPTFSVLQSDTVKFRKALLQSVQVLTFLGLSMTGGLFVLCQEFVHLFLTDKWLPLVPLMQILCVQSMFSFVNTPANVAFQAYGKPEVGTKINLFGNILLLLLVYPLASRWGVKGVVSALLLSSAIPSPVIWFAAIRLVQGSIVEFMKPVVISILNAAVMIVVITAVKDYVLKGIDLVNFFALIAAGIFSYIGMAFISDKFCNYRMFVLLRECYSGFRSK